MFYKYNPCYIFSLSESITNDVAQNTVRKETGLLEEPDNHYQKKKESWNGIATS